MSDVVMKLSQSSSQVNFTSKLNKVKFSLSGNTSQTVFSIVPVIGDYTLSRNAVTLTITQA